MITKETLAGFIRRALPDAEVTVTDKTGMMDHFIVRVVSAQFEGKSLLDRNRLVYQALNEPMQDGRIHAVEIKAEAPVAAK
jgi:stress-induced morphogen